MTSGSRRSAGITLLSLYLTVFFVTLIFNISDPGRIKTDKGLVSVNESLPDDAFSLYVQILSFDEVHQTSKMRIYLYPPASLGNAFASSVQTYKRVQLNLDAARIDLGEEDLIWNSGEYIRAIDFEIDATNEAYSAFTNDSYFPFDRYSLRSNAQIEVQIQGEETVSESDDVWVSPPVRIIPYTSVLPGWTLTYDNVSQSKSALSEQENGLANFEVKITRPGLHKTIAAVISLIFFLGSLAISIYAVSLLNHKKRPEVEGLVWAASTVFALIQTRSILPNDPRVGVKLDLLVFYPSLILTFISSGLIFVYWLKEIDSPKTV